jgi:Ca2+-binding RTX toxin-like protein
MPARRSKRRQSFLGEPPRRRRSNDNQVSQHPDDINVIKGDVDDNIIEGSSANDLIVGSYGNDLISGGAGTDIVSYSDFDEPITLVRAGAVVKADGSTDVFPDFSVEAFVGAKGEANVIDASTGITAAVAIDLGEGSLTVSGIPGLDPVSFQVENFVGAIGTQNSDSITGSRTNNVLQGETGDDSIAGGRGKDILSGGEGSDTFVFEQGDSRAKRFDVITDLAIGTDIIDGWSEVSVVQNLGSIDALVKSEVCELLDSSALAQDAAALFQVTGQAGEEARTFLAINDGSAGFSWKNDSLIEITGFSGDLEDLSII